MTNDCSAQEELASYGNVSIRKVTFATRQHLLGLFALLQGKRRSWRARLHAVLARSRGFVGWHFSWVEGRAWRRRSWAITATVLGLAIPLGAVSRPLPSGLAGRVAVSGERLAVALADWGVLVESDPTSARAGRDARFGRSAFTGGTAMALRMQSALHPIEAHPALLSLQPWIRCPQTLPSIRTRSLDHGKEQAAGFRWAQRIRSGGWLRP